MSPGISAAALSCGTHYLCDPDDRNTLATITTSSAMKARRYISYQDKDTGFMVFVRRTHVFRNGIAWLCMDVRAIASLIGVVSRDAYELSLIRR
jgi:hypothetical protein